MESPIVSAVFSSNRRRRKTNESGNDNRKSISTTTTDEALHEFTVINKWQATVLAPNPLRTLIDFIYWIVVFIN